MTTDREKDLPIACTLTMDELRARRGDLLPGLLELADRSEDIPDGRRYRFAASAATFDAIVRAINAERQCCRFFRFRLTIEPDLGPFWLEVAGPPGTREFLADVIGLA